MNPEPVRLERSDGVGLIVVNHPPVNALSRAVSLGLIETLAAFEADDALRSAVLACDGRTFIAGADINEFDQTPQRGESPRHAASGPGWEPARSSLKWPRRDGRSRT